MLLALAFGCVAVAFLPQQYLTQAYESLPRTSDVHRTVLLQELALPKHGYVLTHRFSGQQGAGILALLSQQCWVGSFNLPMYIVEPFFGNSVAVSRPPLPPEDNGTTLLRFSDYFDSEYFNSVSDTHGYARLASWEDFEQNAPRSLILVQVQMQSGNSDGNFVRSPGCEIVWEVNDTTASCYKEKFRYTRKMLYLIRQNFCVVKVINVFAVFVSERIFTAAEMYDVIFGKWHPDQVTVMFTLWRSVWNVPNPALPIVSVCNANNFLVALGNRLHPSERLLKDATNYKKLYLDSRNSVAVMMRSEHSVWLVEKIGMTIESCLEKVLDLVRDIQEELGSCSMFTTADVGAFASGSWEQTFVNYNYSVEKKSGTLRAIKHAVEVLHDKKFTFEEWEQSFSKVTGGIQDRGYIAALQRTIASQADCLILMGGGDFQALALQDYLHNHPDKSKQCIHTVCQVCYINIVCTVLYSRQLLYRWYGALQKKVTLTQLGLSQLQL